MLDAFNTDKTKLNPAARGLKTRNDQSVQKTEQYLYCFLPLIHRTVQLSWVRSEQPGIPTKHATYQIVLPIIFVYCFKGKFRV